MTTKKKDPLFFNWSTGKDSAFALFCLLQEGEFHIDHLFTSVNKHYDRVSMHGLRRSLMEQQIHQIGMNYSTLELPETPSMEDYTVLMEKAVSGLVEKGYRNTAFGDIFLEDLRKYREENLAQLGVKAHFPLWKKPTEQLAKDFLKTGFQSIVICVDGQLLGEEFVGRLYDESFLNDLPPEVDPCGENGEFHTFCFNGPIFQSPVAFEIGEKTYRSYKKPDTGSECFPESDNIKEKDPGFWFCDLI